MPHNWTKNTNNYYLIPKREGSRGPVVVEAIECFRGVLRDANERGEKLERALNGGRLYEEVRVEAFEEARRTKDASLIAKRLAQAYLVYVLTEVMASRYAGFENWPPNTARRSKKKEEVLA